MVKSFPLLLVPIIITTHASSEGRSSPAHSLGACRQRYDVLRRYTEFLVLRGFSTTTFFFIVVMAFFDVVAGFTISIVGARRDLGTTGSLIGTN